MTSNRHISFVLLELFNFITLISFQFITLITFHYFLIPIKWLSYHSPIVSTSSSNTFTENIIHPSSILSFIHSFVHSFIHPFIHSFIRSSIHPFTHRPSRLWWVWCRPQRVCVRSATVRNAHTPHCCGGVRTLSFLFLLLLSLSFFAILYANYHLHLDTLFSSVT